ncbi:MAG: hypothetical protein HQM10_26585 [Candidatus Riflebacteria bacterium]|nr:hypothetical protein [Candidatus Riflebacteria bacterium]
MERFHFSTDELSSLFGVTRKCISDWCAKGMPKVKYGVYDLQVVFPWWQDNIGSNEEDRDETLLQAKRQYWMAKAESERLKVDKEKENLFPKSEILQEWVGRVGEIKAGLRSLEVRLPPVLEGKNQEEMGDIIEKETWLLLDTYSRNGRFTPKPVEKKAITKGNKK